MSICDPTLNIESNHRQLKKKFSSQQQIIKFVKRGSQTQIHRYMCTHMHKPAHEAGPYWDPDLGQGSERWESRELGEQQPDIKKCLFSVSQGFQLNLDSEFLNFCFYSAQVL